MHLGLISRCLLSHAQRPWNLRHLRLRGVLELLLRLNGLHVHKLLLLCLEELLLLGVAQELLLGLHEMLLLLLLILKQLLLL